MKQYIEVLINAKKKKKNISIVNKSDHLLWSLFHYFSTDVKSKKAKAPWIYTTS